MFTYLGLLTYCEKEFWKVTGVKYYVRQKVIYSRMFEVKVNLKFYLDHLWICLEKWLIRLQKLFNNLTFIILCFCFTEKDYVNIPEFRSRRGTLPVLDNIITTEVMMRRKMYEIRADKADGADELTQAITCVQVWNQLPTVVVVYKVLAR